MKIAVIGAGISGVAAAWLLSRRHEVHLFEKDERIGGHSNTVLTPAGVPVDTGFIVYNEHNYPNLTALLGTLGVATGASRMTFGVSLGEGAYEYAGDSNVLRMFVQRRNWLSVRHHRMWLDILRFNRAMRRGLAAGTLPDVPLGEFLGRQGYGAELGSRYLLPMAGAIWSCSTRAALDFPLPTFARFFGAHGLLDVVNGPQWRYVQGGSRSYLRKLLSEFHGQRRVGEAVAVLRRAANGVRVATVRGEEHFDAAVCATHTDQALRLLADADATERAVLGAIRYAANEAVLHTDATLMPQRRRAWCSWNYLAAQDGVSDRRVTVSYWMNQLQGIDVPENYIVTLNPARAPAPEKVLYRTLYEHPVFTGAAVAAQAQLPQIQGRRGVWFCGAWTGYGFHEDGLKSALSAVQLLDPACLPSWAVVTPAPGYRLPGQAPAGVQRLEALDSGLRRNDEQAEPAVETP